MERDQTIRHWYDAESLTLMWMRQLGHLDAELTSKGADGGVDARSGHAVAQVKAWTAPVGIDEVQCLFGIASSEQRSALLFSLAGYTSKAKAWATAVGVELYTFDLSGRLEPANEVARKAMSETQGKAHGAASAIERQTERGLKRQAISLSNLEIVEELNRRLARRTRGGPISLLLHSDGTNAGRIAQAVSIGDARLRIVQASGLAVSSTIELNHLLFPSYPDAVLVLEQIEHLVPAAEHLLHDYLLASRRVESGSQGDAHRSRLRVLICATCRPQAMPTFLVSAFAGFAKPI